MKIFNQDHYKGGEKASRNNPNCYSKQNQKEIQPEKKLTFSRKNLSLETAYTSLGLSENLKNLLKIGTSGDVSSKGENSNLQLDFTILTRCFCGV